jgi:ParB-like chromosome segregation protein Spo0J
MSNVITLETSAVIFDKELYTRTESQSPAKVQEYAKSIAGGQFPPILLSHERKLLDGWHRWMAHKEVGLETIEAETLDTTGMDVFTIKRKAARSNFRHGQPQTEKELKKLIRDEYRAKLDTLDQKGRADLKKEMAADFSRSERYIREATSRIDKDLKAELRDTVFNMWMACYSQDEIANTVGYTRQAVGEFLNSLQDAKNGTSAENGELAENPALTFSADDREFDEDEEAEDSNSLGVYQLDKRLLFKANHMDESYKPPVYNIWKQQDRSDQVSHFGNSEISFVDNLLYLYTKPFDVVIDPFAGGGSTIDLCRERLRRYLVSDRKPIDIRSDIRQHDIKDGVLSPPTWKEVKLVYLDPPYWKQAENKYSEDADDLANMPLETFNEALAGLVKTYAEKLKRARTEGAHIALIIQPTQWKSNENKDYVDHIGDLLRSVKLPVHMRYSVPYESQQCTAQMVEWAKANKRCLVLTREIIVWEVA